MANSKSVQEAIDEFWKRSLVAPNATTKMPKVLPEHVIARMVSKKAAKDDAVGQNISLSYEEAVKECEAKVAKIVAECKRTNTKYTDVHFDLDEWGMCLIPLDAGDDASDNPGPPQDSTVTYQVTQTASSQGGPIYWGNVQPQSEDDKYDGPSRPACSKRIGKIFKNPRFFIDQGDQIKDIRQGAAGDCWFLSSLDCLCVDAQIPELIERLCPPKARDEKVGVYGFVFFRDGEWISEVIDDKLYLLAPDYDDCTDARRAAWENRTNSRTDPTTSREDYKKTFQTGSEALFYGSSSHTDETWVPLIEKAYAKAHGDYEAINGGWPGEGIEDLTGGVTTKIVCDDILDDDLLWKEGFLNVNKEFLFSAASRRFDNPDDGNFRQGIADGHAYSLIKAAEYNGERLCMVKNPWGRAEWNGAWSDGSKEWTVDALQTLGHTFGDDGIFWMPYSDFLQRYWSLWRTRVFTPEWSVTQKWMTLQVPWSGKYNDTKFEFTLPEATRAIIVLSQLDTRYFGGLTGQYKFELGFRLHNTNDEAYLVRGHSNGDRSASAELDLEAGTYDVLLQISAWRDTDLPTVEKVVKHNWLSRREKLMRIGLSYELANAKGREEDEEEPPKKEEPAKTEEEPKKEEAAAKDTNPVQAAATAVQEIVTNVVQSTKPESTVTNGTTTTETKEPEKSKMEAPSSHEKPPGSVPNGVGEAPLPEPDVEAEQPTPAPAPAPAEEEKPAEPEPEEGEEPPWDATCVIGLRIFCHKTSATIKIVKPTKEAVATVPTVKLDSDDPEKDAAEKVKEEKS